MKKIFFSLIFVLTLFHSTFSIVPQALPVHNLEIVHQESLFFSQNSQTENLYFDVDLIEEDNDDIDSSAWDKFSLRKDAFADTSFIAHIFPDRSFNRIWYSCNFSPFSQPGFISLRV